MDGLLSSRSPNFNKDATIKPDMEQFPVFMRLAIHSPNFHEECTTFNNILLMAVTKVCNYCDTPGFSNRGPGNACVMLNGRVHHFMKTAYSNNTHNCRLSYIIFDNSASHALSSESRNINEQTLNDIADGLKHRNPYCMELPKLGLSVQAGVNIIPRMVDQSAFKTMYAVTNCRQTGFTTLNVTSTNGSILDMKLNSEKVEPLWFL
jgi:hypothetical protein